MNPEQILESLDAQQREAATALVGPVCILAGAGTGKTRTITHRIAYGIAKGYYAANRVLALTYTNRAAGELRVRLRDLGIPGVSVKTFHAAALSQLQFFWPQFAGIPAPTVIESKAKLIASAAQSLGFSFDAPSVRDIAAEIEWRKYSMLSLDEYASVAATRGVVAGLSAEQMVKLQELYEQTKAQANRIDWEDVLVLTLGLLRAEPRALEHVRAQYRFFTVDEYQDISPLQHALLDEWLGDHQDLCVVGDPNQTIYSFTGATSAYLSEFAERFTDATVLQLNQNYRSTKEIVNFANRLTAGVTNLEPLQSKGQQGFAPLLQAAESVADESQMVAQAVLDRIAQGLSPSQIAVLYRVNGQSEAIENALTHLGVEYQVRGGERFFSRAEVLRAIQAIKVESLGQNAKPLFQSVTDIMRSLGWQTQAPAAKGAAFDSWESLNAIVQMVDEMPANATLEAFVQELDERARSQHEPLKSSVTLSTIHAAKGLEWDAVFIIGLTEGYLPISYARLETEIAEERRLLYVGVTRARKQLNLSWPLQDVAGGRKREPSRFVRLLTRS
ncbi:MAG: ATP-dependent helicase [Microbacteriaceae bacterium]